MVNVTYVCDDHGTARVKIVYNQNEDTPAWTVWREALESERSQRLKPLWSKNPTGTYAGSARAINRGREYINGMDGG